MMNINIRQETPKDYKRVAEIIEAAFIKDPHSDQKEHILVAKLRDSESFIPELSLVAEDDSDLLGHILLTPVSIVNPQKRIPTLALAPVSVRTDVQDKGIGKQLINRAHQRAKDLGFKHIVLVGHEHYYPKFGYELASHYRIEFPFPAPEVNCMVKALEPNALDDVYGLVEYPEQFTE